MIPKVIHYCWFSGDEYPSIIKKSIRSWKKILKGYAFKKWDASNTLFDNAFARKAFKEKKWAFLTDYIRFKVLYEEGGVFLDTDVLMIKSFDELLHYSSFWNFANNGMVEPVVVGAKKGNELIFKCKNVYENYTETDLLNYKYVEVPKIITPIFVKNGLKPYQLSSQLIDNNIILSHNAFCPMPFENASLSSYKKYIYKDTYAVHLWNANWIDDEFRFFWNNRWGKGWKIVVKKIINNPFQELSYYRDIIYHLLRQIKIRK